MLDSDNIISEFGIVVLRPFGSLRVISSYWRAGEIVNRLNEKARYLFDLLYVKVVCQKYRSPRVIIPMKKG